MRLLNTTAIILWLALCFTVGYTRGILAQNATPPPMSKYMPTEIQRLRLEVKQKDAQLAQRDVQEVNVRFQKALTDFQAEAEKVRKENGWPDTVTFDFNLVKFDEAPKPATKPEPKK